MSVLCRLARQRGRRQEAGAETYDGFVAFRTGSINLEMVAAKDSVVENVDAKAVVGDEI